MPTADVFESRHKIFGKKTIFRAFVWHIKCLHVSWHCRERRWAWFTTGRRYSDIVGSVRRDARSRRRELQVGAKLYYES